MAPCSSVHHTSMSEKESIKLRKPIVEKLRRDRINACIQQLKVILEKEFHKQEPNSKLEKADILEMTVSFLRQQLQLGPSLQDQKLHQLQGTGTFSSLRPTTLQDSPVWRPW